MRNGNNFAMGRVKIRNKTFNVSEITRLAHYSLHETLLYLGTPKEELDKVYCLGVGTVTAIQKGEEFDLVCMDFGRGFSREIFVKNNHARRQIYTLKRGQLAWFYGFMKSYIQEGRKKASFFAKGFQGWYVPKNMDIIKIKPDDVDKLTEENESKLNFLDDLLKGEQDDNND